MDSTFLGVRRAAQEELPVDGRRLGLKRVGEERKEEEDVRTSSNCSQFRSFGRGGRRWSKWRSCCSAFYLRRNDCLPELP